MKINVERMRYKNDSMTFWLCMFGMVFNIVHFIQVHANCYLQTMTGKEGLQYVYIGLDILYNILFMLVVFYMAEELKTYHVKWNIAAVIIGILQLFRIGWFPKIMYDNAFYGDELFGSIKMFLILSALCFFATAVVSTFKSTLLIRFIKANKAAE